MNNNDQSQSNESTDNVDDQKATAAFSSSTQNSPPPLPEGFIMPENQQSYVAPPNRQAPQSPQQSISGWKVDGVAMVNAREFATGVNATFGVGKTFTGWDTLNFSANGRFISVRTGEKAAVGEIYFKPGPKQAPDGRWYLPYPVAAFLVEPFLDPTAILPDFTAKFLYLTSVSDDCSQETEKMISALCQRYSKIFRRVEKTGTPSVSKSALVLLKINQLDAPGASDCNVTIGLVVPPEPMEKTSDPVAVDIKLAAILAVNILQAFGHAQVGLTYGGTVTAWKEPQPWDVPTLIINLDLTEAGYERLAKNRFETVSRALSEGLRAFNDEIGIGPVPVLHNSGRPDLRCKLIPPLPPWVTNRYAKDYSPAGSPEHRSAGSDQMPHRVENHESLQYIQNGSWYTLDDLVEFQKA